MGYNYHYSETYKFLKAPKRYSVRYYEDGVFVHTDGASPHYNNPLFGETGYDIDRYNRILYEDMLPMVTDLLREVYNVVGPIGDSSLLMMNQKNIKDFKSFKDINEYYDRNSYFYQDYAISYDTLAPSDELIETISLNDDIMWGNYNEAEAKRDEELCSELKSQYEKPSTYNSEKNVYEKVKVEEDNKKRTVYDLLTTVY